MNLEELLCVYIEPCADSFQGGYHKLFENVGYDSVLFKGSRLIAYDLQLYWNIFIYAITHDSQSMECHIKISWTKTH